MTSYCDFCGRPDTACVLREYRPNDVDLLVCNYCDERGADGDWTPEEEADLIALGICPECGADIEVCGHYEIYDDYGDYDDDDDE